MNPCPTKLSPLGCKQTGVGFLQTTWSGCGTTIQLFAGQGAQFPQPVNGQSFWVDVDGTSCGGSCCARLEVIARTADTLTLRNPDCSCDCIPATSKVSYAHNSPEHIRMVASELGFNVVPPLRFDCATRTLSINCEELKQMVNMPCAM
jgi:hypothetical protein